MSKRFNKQEETNSELLVSQEDPFAEQEKEEAYSFSSATNSLQSSEVGRKSDSWSNGKDDSSHAGNNETIVHSFEHMGLREPLLRGIYSYGFELPSAIQQKAIIPCCKGQDVIAQAQSGTGKTATFAVGILQQIDVAIDQCQVYITVEYCISRNIDSDFNLTIWRSRKDHQISLCQYQSIYTTYKHGFSPYSNESLNIKFCQQCFLSKPPNIMFAYISAYTVYQ